MPEQMTTDNINSENRGREKAAVKGGYRALGSFWKWSGGVYTFLRGKIGMFPSCGSGCHSFKCYLEKLGKKKYLKIRDICGRQNKLRVPKKVDTRTVQGTQ